MTDQFEPTPIPAALERDAITAGVVDSSPLGGILTDGTLQVIHISPRAYEMLGIETVTERSMADVLRRSRLLRPELATRSLGNSSTSHHLVESKQGDLRCIALSPVKCARREVRWLFWIEDVTAVHHAQQFKLLAEIGRSTQASTQTLAERLVDAALGILKVDIAVLMLGDIEALRPAATRGLLLDDDFVLHPRDRAYLRKAMESLTPVVSNGSEWDNADQEMTGEHYIVPLVASGAVVGSLHLSLLSDGAGASFDMSFLEVLSAYAGAAIANARLFEEVRDERIRLKTVVDFIPEGVILYTARGDVLAVNETANRIAERRWVNMNTDSRSYTMYDERGERLRRVDWPFFRLKRDGLPILDEVVQLDFNGRRKVLSVNAIPVPALSDETPPTYIGTLRDITAERERQLEREAFLQTVSHELRSPLTPLTGFLQMVRKQAESGEEIDAELFRRAEHQVSRLARLIDRVLDLSRMERHIDLSCETVDLRDIARTTAAIWQTDVRRADVEIATADVAVLIDADADRIEQVITNLIDNAVKHSPTTSVVRVVVDFDEAHQPRLRVTDEGSGIAPDALPRIFERFYSGAHDRGGMGIGLYITEQLVRAHGGRVTARSELGVGTQFDVVFPAISH